ncbi:MAG: Spy/CpxP family protein refolding chaperone [Rubrivivax sp.]
MTFQHTPIKLYAAGLALALAGVCATTASAAPGGHGMMGQGPTMGQGGPMMGHGGMGGSMMGGMLPQMLDRVNATPEQRAKIKQITDAGVSEMRAQREAGRALREQTMALFAQPTVDAAAVEVLRQKQLAMHDAASRRMTASMLAVSSVLTPEQRKLMADTMTQRREMMQRHHRERQAVEAPKS